MKFSDFHLHSELISGLEAMGFEEPTPIQEQAIPPVMEGKDLIGCAQTGTGKTAAYLLPMLHHLIEGGAHGIQTIIIAPTRELAVQIDQQLEGFLYFTSLSSITIYGGKDGAAFDVQKNALKRGTDIIIATPGKLISHLNLGYVDTSGLKYLILDEADRMLDMGFYEDIIRIASFLPEKRHTLMFSATMPPKIRQLSKTLLENPEEINIALSTPAENILQVVFHVYGNQKLPLIEHLLKAKRVNSLIVFCSRKTTVKEVGKILNKLDYNVAAIHSDLEQDEREEVLRQFKSKQLQILVATDILSRGIDVEGIELVVNYDLPNDPEDYVHRIGRTARADASGAAFTFVEPQDQYSYSRIVNLIGDENITVAKLPEYLGEAPSYDPGKKHSSGGRSKGKGGGGKKKFAKKRAR